MISGNGQVVVQQEESIGFQILRSIRRIIRRTSEHSRSVCRHSGVTVPQMLCLKAISEFEPSDSVTVAMVAKTVQLSAPTVSRILDRLERAGFILRERAKTDRRKVCVSLTDSGWQRVDNLPTPLHEQFLQRLERIDPVERLGLLKALERIVELMDAEGIDAAPVLTPELEVGPDGTTSTVTFDDSNTASPDVSSQEFT
ncbi:MAG: MarR family transcriptional regulator [Planctomycetales bacterium]|nr:MarR family transcriptional regulator [Planctomycetales bacterium]